MDNEIQKKVDDAYKVATQRANKDKNITSNLKEFDYYSFWSKGNNKVFSQLEFGDIFLYQVVESSRVGATNEYIDKMSYPKIATYIEMLPCDQTLEFRFCNKPRTWMQNVEYLCNIYHGQEIFSSVYERGTEIESCIPWGNTALYVFAHWKSMPDWKQLRRAYEKTIWFYNSKEDLRDRMLNSLV